MRRSLLERSDLEELMSSADCSQHVHKPAAEWDVNQRSLRLGVALYRMWDVDDARCTFRADFRIHATWMALPHETSASTVPEWNFSNSVEDFVVVDTEEPRLAFPGEPQGTAKSVVWTSSTRYRASFFRDHSTAQDAAFRRFPMDVHQLDIIVRIPRVHKQRLAVVDSDPLRSSCQSILTRADAGLVDFRVLDVNTWVYVNEPNASNYKPDFIVSITVARRATYYLICVFGPLMVIAMISVISFLMDSLADKVNLVLTAVLCVVAFKFTVAARLPILPSTTHLDRYIVSLYILFILMALCHVVENVLVLRGVLPQSAGVDFDLLSFNALAGIAFTVRASAGVVLRGAESP